MHNDTAPAPTPERTFIEAIALKRLVSAVYNGAGVLLAPHQLFERHGSTFVSALNTARTWRSDEEPRLGQFKLDGLTEVVLSEGSFEPLPGFAGELPREGDAAIFSVAA